MCLSTNAEKSRSWRQANPAKMLAYDAKRRARMKGITYAITAADVDALLTHGWECIYCLSPVGSFTGGQRAQSVTVDRLIPELGYTPDNIVIACHQCNCSKAEHTPASLRAWADRIEEVIRNRQNPETDK